MAYIKITGGERIEATNEEVQRIARDIEHGVIKREEFVRIGNWQGRASEIRGFLFDLEDKGSDFSKKTAEWNESVRQFIGMSPEAKAEQSIKHFELFYHGYFGGRPDKEIAQKILPELKGFYENNPKRTSPDLKLYVDFFGLSEGFRMNEPVLALLERAEQTDKSELKYR